jgi:glycosyltransferase involved in cell wall biosynthesis
MSDLPQTSVIIPVFNGEFFLLEAINSVLTQLEPHDELLVVDDASTDGTLALLLGLSDRRLRVLSSNGGGPSVARNKGISAARGEFIAFLDHDDLWPIGRHVALRATLLADDSIDATAGRIAILEESIGTASKYQNLHGRYGASLPFTCLYRRSLIQKTGYFDETMRFGEDVDYHIRLTESGMKITYCDLDSLIYRRHAGNATNFQPAHGKLALALVIRKLVRNRNKSPF